MSDKKKTEDALIVSRGCDIDELRYRRAFALAKYELAKMRLMETVDSVRDGVPSFGGRGIMGKMLSSLNYIDYALIAYKIGSKLMKFRKRK